MGRVAVWDSGSAGGSLARLEATSAAATPGRAGVLWVALTID